MTGPKTRAKYDRIAVMFEGQIAQLDDPETLYRRPKSRQVADFIGTMNFLPATLVAATEARATVRLPDGQTLEAAVDARRLSAGAPVTLGLRPEHMRLAPSADSTSTARCISSTRTLSSRRTS